MCFLTDPPESDSCAPPKPLWRLKHRVVLFVFAIALHNLPEGLAIGVGYANHGIAGNAFATGIAIQDIPTGWWWHWAKQLLIQKTDLQEQRPLNWRPL